MSLINFPILYIPDPDKGRPLFNGQIYVGEPDLDPTVLINQKQLRVIQEDGTLVDVAQPFVLSAGGVPQYLGKPVRLDVTGNYSIKILSKLGAQVYYIENVFEGEPVTVESQINDLSQAYTFKTVALMQASLIIFPVGKKLFWQGYYAESDGGSNWGIVTSGAHTDDGGSIFTLDDGKYIKANLKGKKVSVIKFGAKGDGINDDTQRILAAFNVSYPVRIPKGDYKCTSVVNIPDNTHIEMEEDARLFVEDGYMTTGTGQVFIRMALGKNITIKGGTIDGGVGPIDLAVFPDEQTTTVKADYGLTSSIEMVSCSSLEDVTFEGVRFINCIYNAIKENGSFSSGTQAKRVTIKGCYFDNVLGNDIDGNFQDSLFTDNHVNLTGDIRDATRGSFIISSARNCVVSNNVIRQTTDSTIYLTGTIEQGHTTVTGNVIAYGGKDAIKFVQSGSNGTISGNHVLVAGKTSIGVFDDGVTDYGSVAVTGNSCGYRVTPTDILDPDTHYTTPLAINGCNIQNPKWVGAYDSACIAAAASYCTVSGNTINNAIGLTISVSEKGCVISGNSAYFCAGPMIYSTTFGVTLTGNSGFNLGGNSALVFNNIEDGIYIGGSSEISITGNTLNTVQGKGIRINNGSNVLISSNSIDATVSDGIYADHLSNSVKIDANNITDSGGNGIYVNGVAGTFAKLTSITNNTVQRSTSRGLWLRELNNAVVSNNTVSENTSDGIRVSDNGIGISITGNVSVDNTGDGLRVSDTDNFVLSNNYANGNSSGIVTEGSCDQGTIIGNVSIGNTTEYSLSGTNLLPAVLVDFNR